MLMVMWGVSLAQGQVNVLLSGSLGGVGVGL